EVERWVDDALGGMENALKANPKDLSEQYEKKIDDLHAAYGEAMLQIKFLKKLNRHLDQDDD
ncbi:transposase, partial [Vibrio sp. SM6]|nr:transposase [Vibrio agarilyticus]